VRFVRSFPMAGESMTWSIVEECHIEFSEAEAKKRDIGLSTTLGGLSEGEGQENGAKLDDQIGQALNLYSERFATEVELSVRYFSATRRCERSSRTKATQRLSICRWPLEKRRLKMVSRFR